MRKYRPSPGTAFHDAAKEAVRLCRELDDGLLEFEFNAIVMTVSTAAESDSTVALERIYTQAMHFMQSYGESEEEPECTQDEKDFWRSVFIASFEVEGTPPELAGDHARRALVEYRQTFTSK